MDENKRLKLVELCYAIANTCSSCMHSRFSNEKTPFGDCGVQTYDHLKHSDSKRPLSIHRDGSCDKYKRSPSSELVLGLWLPFAADYRAKEIQRIYALVEDRQFDDAQEAMDGLRATSGENDDLDKLNSFWWDEKSYYEQTKK